jgi:hypothetical protein
MNTRPRRTPRERARGTVLVLFAMITVVVLGLLGLVIEMGIARHGRQRMRDAADAAALEVLRERDWVRPELGAAAPDVRDHDRRARNRLLASWPFAGEALADSYTASEAGAGAFVSLAAGEGELGAGQLLAGTGSSVPVLETNYQGAVGGGAAVNAPHGDIVSGAFTGHEPDAPVGVDDNPVWREDGDYGRVDFQPASAGDAPFADAVLVRLRRTVPLHSGGTNPWSPLDVQAGVSSSGATMPLLFGLGSLFSGSDPGAGYSVRHHGLPLRATSIASSRPAVRVGVARPDLGPEWAVGAAPLSFDLREWVWKEGSWAFDEATGAAAITIRIRPPYYEFVVPEHDSNVAGYLRRPTEIQVGDRILLGDLQPDPGPGGVDQNLDESFWAREECYVPLYWPYANGVSADRIVCGFGRVRIEPGEDTGTAGTEEGDIFIRVTKLPNERSPGHPWIAPRNASAVFDGDQPAALEQFGVDLWPDVIQRLFASPAPLTGGANPHVPDARVHAPALVR